jgi:hypothetical protein
VIRRDHRRRSRRRCHLGNRTDRATARSPILRAAIGLLFAVPATIAGYHATLRLAQIGVPAEGWREAFAIVGVILVGGTTWVRVTLFVPLDAERSIAAGRASLPLAGATTER